MQSPQSPVSENDPDEMVLERILTTLEQSGPMQIGEIVERLNLYKHPLAEKILGMAVGDGMIEPENEAEGVVKVSDFGRDVARDIRKSLEDYKHVGGKY